MPSGAKKRKAAKKKENQPNDSRSSSASTQSHGIEDVKQQEDKVGDMQDVNLPTLDHIRSQENLLSEDKEEVIQEEKKLTNLPSENESRTDIDEKNVDCVTQVQRNLKIDNGSYGKEKGIEHFEADGKYSYNGVSHGSSMSSRCSSSSDDESHGIKSGQAAVDSAWVAESLSGKSAEDNSHSVPIRDHGNVVAGNLPLAKQTEVETVSTADSTLAPCAIESVLKENGEQRLICVDGKVGTSECLTNATALKREEEEIAPYVENISAPYDPKAQKVAQENDNILLAPQCAPAAVADNGAKTEALLVPSTQPVQKTSWKSCCGLFDMFLGSRA